MTTRAPFPTRGGTYQFDGSNLIEQSSATQPEIAADAAPSAEPVADAPVSEPTLPRRRRSRDAD